MTDTRPPVKPIEGHYGVLRDGTLHGPIFEDIHPRDGKAYWVGNDLNVDPNGKGLEDRDDLVALISPEQLGFALSLSEHQLDLADQRMKSHTAAKVFEILTRLKKLSDENDELRGFIANSDIPCIYCGLSKADMNKCASGFPGCGRADDMLLTMDFTEELPEPHKPEAQDDNQAD